MWPALAADMPITRSNCFAEVYVMTYMLCYVMKYNLFACMLVSEPVCSLLSAICMPHTAESFKNSKAGQSQVFDIYMIQES